ncbi:MAG: hypothetical protein MR018_05060 [Clostridiales bacterium]|nr:hypothetical protein [Clostridiales bacterium]
MQDAYDAFFDGSAAHKYHNVLFSDSADPIRINRIGLHNIHHKKAVRESHFHSHSFYEFHFSLGGCAVYQFAGQLTIPLEKGSWLLIPVNCPHMITAYSDRYIKYSCAFQLNREAETGERRCLASILDSPEPRQGVISADVLEWIGQIYRRLSDPHPLAKLAMKMLTANIILSAAAQIGGVPDENGADQQSDPRLVIAAAFIKDNLYRGMTGKDAAKKVHLSLRQLDRIFQQSLSVPVGEFISEQKIEEARSCWYPPRCRSMKSATACNFPIRPISAAFSKKRVGKPPLRFRMDSKKGE